MTKQHSDVPATVDSESLGEEAAADGRAVEEVKQAEWQIIPTKRATVVAVSNKHGEASQRATASAMSEPPSGQGHGSDLLASR